MKVAKDFFQKYLEKAEEEAVSYQKRKILDDIFEDYERELDRKIMHKNFCELLYNSDFVGFTVCINSKGILRIDNDYCSELAGYPLEYEQFRKLSNNAILSEFFDKNIRKYLERKGYYVGGIAKNRKWLIYTRNTK